MRPYLTLWTVPQAAYDAVRGLAPLPWHCEGEFDYVPLDDAYNAGWKRLADALRSQGFATRIMFHSLPA